MTHRYGRKTRVVAMSGREYGWPKYRHLMPSQLLGTSWFSYVKRATHMISILQGIYFILTTTSFDFVVFPDLNHHFF